MAIESTQCYVNWAGPVTAATFPTGSAPPTPDPVVQLILTALGGSFSQTGFFAAEAAKNQILAVALAAVSTQSPVVAWVDDPALSTGGYLQCYGLQVKGS